MSKYLIVPGLPKSGTTFLYAQLSSQTEHFNVPAQRKEIDYFRRGESLSEYRSLFVENCEDKVYLDCSPLYSDDILPNTNFIENCLAGQEIKIVLCVRNPFERMYSHYLHDIAQNFQIHGMGAHNIYTPSVMSRYIYPLASRVQFYIDRFGAENVYGFSFASRDTNTEDKIRSFANLPEQWRFDFSQNPARGFTSPTSFYSDRSDVTVAISGSLYVLPKRDLLIANRQFSALHRNIAPNIGNNIMKNNSFINREFDAGSFKDSINVVWDDYEKALDLLKIDVVIDRSDVVFRSTVSNEIPEKWLSKLEYIGPVESTLHSIFENPLVSSVEAIINSVETTSSLSTSMAELERSARSKDPDGKNPEHYLEQILENYGPSPYFLELLFKNWLKSGKVSSVIKFMEQHPKSSGLLRPVQLNTYIEPYRNTMSTEEYENVIRLCG